MIVEGYLHTFYYENQVLTTDKAMENINDKSLAKL